MPTNQEILDIIKGLSQVSANSHDTYDGVDPFDQHEKKTKIGLEREKVENPIINSREVYDGFSMAINRDMLIVNYQAMYNLEDINKKGANGFENRINKILNDIGIYIKKEYRKVTGKSLTLTDKTKKAKTQIQHMSNLKARVLATKIYKIGGIPSEKEEAGIDLLNDMTKKFLQMGKGLDKK